MWTTNTSIYCLHGVEDTQKMLVLGLWGVAADQLAGSLLRGPGCRLPSFGFVGVSRGRKPEALVKFCLPGSCFCDSFQRFPNHCTQNHWQPPDWSFSSRETEHVSQRKVGLLVQVFAHRLTSFLWHFRFPARCPIPYPRTQKKSHQSWWAGWSS